MAENEGNDEAKDAASADEARSRASGAVDPRYAQRAAAYRQNFASRLFPGPSERMSKQAAQHIAGLLRPLEDEGASGIERAGRSRRPTDSARRSGSAIEGGSSQPLSVATPEDIAQVRETLEKQNELLQAILASSVDTQNDARSTAQNSRTFAWAGTAIALLTLIATVLSIIAAIDAH